MVSHPLPVTIVPFVRSSPPVFLAYPLFNNPTNFSHSGIALDENVHIAESLPIHEGEAFFGEYSTHVLDVLHFAVKRFLVLHIRWFWFPDTKVGIKNETYFRNNGLGVYFHQKHQRTKILPLKKYLFCGLGYCPS